MQKQVMTRAWQIASTLKGDISAKLSFALKQAWNEVKHFELEYTVRGDKVSFDGDYEVKKVDEYCKCVNFPSPKDYYETTIDSYHINDGLTMDKAQKAKELRYKNPSCLMLGFDEIQNQVYEIQEKCIDIHYPIDELMSRNGENIMNILLILKKAKGVTYNEIAEGTGIHPKYLQKIFTSLQENNKKLRYNTVEKLAQYFEVSIFDIW